jgi:hypothetical protein
LALVLALGVVRPAAATFHEIMIVQVFGGSDVAPDAQYVLLQMWAGGQEFVGGHKLRFFDAAGTELTLENATFSADVANGADNATILIATATAEQLFGVTADLLMRPSLRVDGGKICWEIYDCFAWGNYSGSATGVGTVYQSADGLTPEQAAVRRIDICQTIGCSDSVLDSADDTDICADNFLAGTPAPTNNSNEAGVLSPDALFLDGFEDNGFGGWSDVQPPA